MGKEQRQLSAADLILSALEREENERKRQRASEEAYWKSIEEERRRKEQELKLEAERRNRLFREIDRRYGVSQTLSEINKKVFKKNEEPMITPPYRVHGYTYGYNLSDYGLDTPLDQAEMVVTIVGGYLDNVLEVCIRQDGVKVCGGLKAHHCREDGFISRFCHAESLPDVLRGRIPSDKFERDIPFSTPGFGEVFNAVVAEAFKNSKLRYYFLPEAQKPG